MTNKKRKHSDIDGLDPDMFDIKNQLIIGIDLGRPGIAYAFNTMSKPELKSILDWPGLETRKQPKVPTLLCYDPKRGGQFIWGAQVPEDIKIEGIKLLLDPDQTKPVYVPATSTKAQLKRLGKPALHAVADYLRALHSHALEKIASQLPNSYLENEVQKRYVMSVPAVWSDKAKDITLQAASLAGISPVTLIKEPEAAALYCLHELQDRGLRVGDALVICDAGGGTVDLISYEIVQRDPALQLKELVPSKGGMAGSLQLNRRFEEQVKILVGEDQYYHLRKTRAYSQAVNFFDDTIKPAFRDKKDESWYVNFPMADLEDDESQGLKRNAWDLKYDTIENIFKPLIEDIGRMVDDQVNLVQKKRLAEQHPKGTEIKAILLVGGFGSSEYLKQNIQRRHPAIQVIQPHDAWSAIVKGAVLSQLPQEAVIVSMVAPRYYGTKYMDLYDEGEDVGQPITWYASEGVYRVSKMRWYIRQGEDLQRDQRIKFPFQRTLKHDYKSSDLLFKDELVTDCSTVPAKYPKKGITKTICTLKSDLTMIDRSHLKPFVGEDGENYCKVDFDLVVTMASAVMKFSLEIGGSEMGSVKVNYD